MPFWVFVQDLHEGMLVQSTHTQEEQDIHSQTPTDATSSSDVPYDGRDGEGGGSRLRWLLVLLARGSMLERHTSSSRQ